MTQVSIGDYMDARMNAEKAISLNRQEKFIVSNEDLAYSYEALALGSANRRL